MILSDGSRPHPKGKYELQPGQTVTLRLPGGGGFFSPMARDPKRVLNDVRQGRVSPEAAREVYGVVVDTQNLESGRCRDRSAQGCFRRPGGRNGFRAVNRGASVAPGCGIAFDRNFKICS